MIDSLLLIVFLLVKNGTLRDVRLINRAMVEMKEVLVPEMIHKVMILKMMILWI